MVTVCFVVEGDSEAFLVKSEKFRQWLLEECHLKLLGDPVNVGGNKQLHAQKIAKFIQPLKKKMNPDKIVVLADLDPDECVSCIQARKNIIGSQDIDLVVIARKALESWFLADNSAMRRWTGNESFEETYPEDTPETPWERFKVIGKKAGLGLGRRNKLNFVKKFICEYGFDVRQAAKHPHCPSAAYFVERVCALGR